MKPYTLEIEIDLPRERVIELFDDPGNMVKWQKGLQSFERLSGVPGEVGAKAKLVYLNGKRRFEMIETVIERNLPDQFDGRYEWRGGRNTVRNRFIELGQRRTKWKSTCLLEFDSFMMKAMGLLFRGIFRKQAMGVLRSFKAYAEDGRDVRDAK